MATPLFVPDEATLIEKLRLSAVPASATDTQAIIDEGVLRARIRFYTELGANRVGQILATPYTDLPTTDDEVLRALASSTEISMVYCYLLVRLPNTFMDSSGDVNERWNEEAPTRERGSVELEDQLRACEDEITSALEQLKGAELDPCPDVKTYDGTPSCPPVPGSAPVIGRTLKRGRGFYNTYPTDF